MKKKVKAVYWQKQIDKLRLEIEDLKNRNASLVRENETLRNTSIPAIKISDKAQEKHRKMMDRYENGLSEVRELKKQFEEVNASAIKMKTEYDNEIQVLLSKMRKKLPLL